MIPPLRIGNFALDLSFLIVMVAAYLLLRLIVMASLTYEPSVTRVTDSPRCGV